ncbi:unnamed protein product [Amaranthus hypochondriacus]
MKKNNHDDHEKNNPNKTLNEIHMIVSGSNTGQSRSQTESDGSAPPMEEVVRGEDIYYDEIIKKIRKNTEGLEKYDDDEIYFLQEELGLTIPPYKPCFLNKKKKLNLDDPILKEALNLTQVNDSDSNLGSSTDNTHTSSSTENTHTSSSTDNTHTSSSTENTHTSSSTDNTHTSSSSSQNSTKIIVLEEGIFDDLFPNMGRVTINVTYRYNNF